MGRFLSQTQPTVKGSVATYTDAAGVGADLVVTALPTGFRHEVVLRRRPAQQVELRTGIEDGGLTLTDGKGGRLLLKGKGKKLVANGTRPAMSDGGGGKDRPASVKRGEADGDVVTKDGRTELVVKPDQAFLADAATMYPVRVAAAAVTLPVNADVEVTSGNDADFPGDPTAPYMMAGTRTGGFEHRVHLKFDTPNLTGSTVTDAKPSTNTIDAQNCSAALANGIQVARLTGAWDPGNVHWASKPAFTTEDASTNFKGVAMDCALAKHITPHTLRHTMITMLRGGGVAPGVMPLIAGHASHATTATYANQHTPAHCTLILNAVQPVTAAASVLFDFPKL
ncbi:DNRLRE domain-containing protein [Nonomuraea sp. NPDC003709]|uniref:DNRLRE domain-containing protein n=1 Tax=Nonomuraea sp. NPDC003709 TaxID=3154450 RepID=UPI0033A09CCA